MKFFFIRFVMGQVLVHKVKYFLNLCLHSFFFSRTVCPAFPDGKVAATLSPFTTKVASRLIRLSLVLNYSAAPVTCLFRRPPVLADYWAWQSQ